MRFELPQEKKFVFEMVIPIRWGDMDAMGHVNNTTYFRYMETVRIEWMNGIGCVPNAHGVGPLIINAFCTFHKQLEYPGDVLAKMYVSEPGRSSFDGWCTLERADEPGVLYASGGATHVWVDFSTQKSAPLPEWMKAHLR